MSEEKEIEEQPLKFEEDEPQKGFFSHFLTVLKVIGIVALLAVTIIYLPLFRLNEIIVKGNQTLTKDEICRIAGIKQGEHIWSIKKDQIINLLQNDLRIEDIRVDRLFPNGLEIIIKERQSIACVACDYGFVDLDGNGIVLEAYRFPKKRGDVVYVSGIKLRDMYIGDIVQDEDMRGILLYLKAISPELRQYMTNLSLANRERISVMTTQGAEIRIGKVERMTEKSRHTENFLNEFAQSNKAVEYVDFQYKSPFIKFK